MAVEEEDTDCHICEFRTECFPCPHCELPTCIECFAPQCPTSTEPVTDCETCHDDYELDHHKEWIQEKIETIRWNATHSPILLTLEVNQRNCSKVEEVLSHNTNYRLTKVTVDRNFVGDLYFKIRLFSHQDVDPWEKENRAIG